MSFPLPHHPKFCCSSSLDDNPARDCTKQNIWVYIITKIIIITIITIIIIIIVNNSNSNNNTNINNNYNNNNNNSKL